MSMDRNSKMYKRLVEAVGKQCEVTLTNGQVIYGVLDSFRWNDLALCVDEGSNRYFLNFRYVTSIRIPKAKAEGKHEGK